MTRICHAPRYAKDSVNSFANVITGWTVQPDQSTAGASTYVEGNSNFRASDLQVGKASGSSALSLNMSHQMGLAVLSLKSKNVVTERTFTYSGNAKPDSTNSNSTLVTVTASSNFDTQIPHNSNGAWYYIVKSTGTSSNTSTTICAKKTEKDYWSKTFTTIGYGKYTSHDAYSCRNYIKYKGIFNYCSNVSYFTIPFYGAYTMEIFGAQGGCYSTSATTRGGYGGHAKGTITLYYNDPIYVCVGGRGGNVGADGSSFVQSSGFNGGGVPDYTTGSDNTSGGGCTHIAREKGTDSKGQLKGLSAYSDYTTNDVILMVAGGGGGGDGAIGGDGGGPTGGNGTAWATGYEGAYGATHTSVGAPNANQTSTQVAAGFGYGGRSKASNSGGGGGGGWYGGGVANGAGGGGGGSGHIATTVTTIAHEQSTHTGHGSATIQSD